MKNIKFPKLIIAFLFLALILSACDGTLPDGLDLNSSGPGVSKSGDENFQVNDSSSPDDESDDINDDSSDDPNKEVFTAIVEAVDGNTVTINGQVFTTHLEDYLTLSDFLTAGQSIIYTTDDSGNEIKIFIEGLGEVEFTIGDDSSGDSSDSSFDEDDGDGEVLTATVEAVDGNTVTINGQVFTADLENGLLLSDFLTAGQSINYTIDDSGDEIKIIIEGLGVIELEIDDEDSDHTSSSSQDDDDDEDSDDSSYDSSSSDSSSHDSSSHDSGSHDGDETDDD